MIPIRRLFFLSFYVVLMQNWTVILLRNIFWEWKQELCMRLTQVRGQNRRKVNIGCLNKRKVTSKLEGGGKWPHVTPPHKSDDQMIPPLVLFEMLE